MTAGSNTRSSINQVLDWAVNCLHPSRTASLDSRVLLEHVTGYSRSRIFAHGEDSIEQKQSDDFRELVMRRAGGEPVAYLRGWVEWYGTDFLVDSSVFVPRPETELVYEMAVELFCKTGGRRALDVGTGSGAIAIQLARSSSQVHLDAVDVSTDALRVAKRNVDRCGVASRVDLLHGHLLEPVSDKPDIIVANLPYLSREMMDDLPDEVAFEPTLALYGGQDGLELYRQLLAQLNRRGWMVPVVVEIDPRQSKAATTLFADALPSLTVEVRRDYAGRDRTVIARPRSSSW